MSKTLANDVANLIEQCLKKDKEIERLKIIEEKYKDSQLYIKDFKEEIERLQNIIKEAKEYLEDNSTDNYLLKSFDVDILLEILDKENKW